MFKKFEVCDCSLVVACHCLEKNVDFDQFQRKCPMLKPTNEIFVIETSGSRSWNVSPVKFLVCCKKFVEFQIGLSWARREYESDVDFDYNNNFFGNYYNNVRDDDSSDDDEQSYIASKGFVSSVCYTEMRTNLKFERFFQSCKDIFKMYFTQNYIFFKFFLSVWIKSNA